MLNEMKKNEMLPAATCFLLHIEKKRPAFERLLLLEYISNGILQHLINYF